MTDPLEPERCAGLLKALADPDRLRIIRQLCGGPKKVMELASLLEAPLVNISHHLSVLRKSGVVQDHKQGRFVIYQLNPQVFQPTDSGSPKEYLDMGCCRLEIPKN